MIAKALQYSIRAGRYRPRPALVTDIPKPDGGSRSVSVFPVADAAVANEYYNRILERNQSRLSPFSYAYRSDIGVHNAIDRLWSVVRDTGRLYVVEFDFSKYFDTIDHSYLLETLHRYFKVTRSEIGIVRALLGSRRAYGLDDYRRERFVECTRGIPQGNSLSLFLANVACHELDMRLERDGMTFARYADDIVILSKSDARAGAALDQILEHCSKAGLAINFNKSEGISEFTPQAVNTHSDSRPSAKSYFDYLGHRFSFQLAQKRGMPAAQLVRRLGIRERSLNRLREKLSNE